MRKFFVVVDAQVDFVTGALPNPAAQAAVPKIKAAAEKALAEGYELIFTLDTHHENYMETGEGKHLPDVHCVEGSDGWRIVPELNDLANKAILLPKEHFGSENWREYISEGDEVTMCGFVSSICVISNALMIKTIEGVEVTILKDCCAGLTEEDHEAAMTVMKCCQCNIV